MEGNLHLFRICCCSSCTVSALSSSPSIPSTFSLFSDWNHHQFVELDAGSSGVCALKDSEAAVEADRTLPREPDRAWSRNDTDRSVSKDVRVGGECVSTIGGVCRSRSSQDGEAGGELWTVANGGESDDVGNVDRVKLSRKGGGRESDLDV